MMKVKNPLLAGLAEHVEKRKPSVKLFEEIAKALGWEKLEAYSCRWVEPDKKATRCGFGPPNWLESVDAAIGLKPDAVATVQVHVTRKGVIVRFDAPARGCIARAKTEAQARTACALRWMAFHG